MSIHAFDLNSDGVCELITGWSNGKVSVLCHYCCLICGVLLDDDFMWVYTALTAHLLASITL